MELDGVSSDVNEPAAVAVNGAVTGRTDSATHELWSRQIYCCCLISIVLHVRTEFDFFSSPNRHHLSCRAVASWLRKCTPPWHSGRQHSQASVLHKILCLASFYLTTQAQLAADSHIFIGRRIQCKIALLTYKSLLTNQPPYLSNLLHVYQPSLCLRSASQNLLSIPSCTINFSRCSFSFSAPTI